MENNNGLFLLALRILPGCANYIRKCLSPDIFYYLNSDFEISCENNEEQIKLRRTDLPPIGSSFFCYDSINTPTINIAAIVGKNGDGKSSIIEVIIRLINNLANRRGLDPAENTLLVDKVCAELFYNINGVFYKLRSEAISDEQCEISIIRFKYDAEKNCYVKDRELTDDEIKTNFFYTLVSNYSHYAYNTEDFADESQYSDEEMHWLHRLFHKNDAYQMPINLHPYRSKGNININREFSLFKQRLLISVTKSLVKDGNKYSTNFEINGKTPKSLYLKDPGVSKLQNVTLKEFFKNNRNVNLLVDEIEELEDFAHKMSYSTHPNEAVLLECSKLISNLYYYLFNLIPEKHNPSEMLSKWLSKALRWMEREGFLESDTDLSVLTKQLDEIVNDFDYSIKSDISFNSLSKHLDEIKQFSLFQLYRLGEILEICKYWEENGMPIYNELASKNKDKGVRKKESSIKLSIDPFIVFEDYDDLLETDRCIQYIIYKTLSIFESYPSYRKIGNAIGTSKFVDILKMDKPLFELKDMKALFDKLGADWSLKSHITLKLRQTYNFFNGNYPTKKIYSLKINTKKEEDKKKNNKLNNEEDNIKKKDRDIYFSTLSKESIDTMSEMDTLPPGIFDWDIKFISRRENDDIGLNSFSSGEKQKLMCQTATIYHLQNINSIATEELHYSHVNLIFEEIELYFHPDWQRAFIDEMIHMIRGANLKHIHSVNMLFVTHSPYILSDIPKSNVLFLKNGMPDYSMQENTFGANINSLLKNGFFLPNIPMGEFAYKKINHLFSLLNGNGVTQENMDKIYAEIMTVGDPAIRAQLMILLAPYRRLFLGADEIENLIAKLKQIGS